MVAESVSVAATIACALSISAPVAAANDDEPAPPAAAREPSPSGPRIALRSGVALPIGEAFFSSGQLSDTITGYVPLRLDLGWRIERHFYIGGAAQLAVILPKACPNGASCSGSNERFGVMVAYHLLPGGSVDPWLGLGVGLELLNLSRTVDSTTTDISARGLELVDIELGADVRPTRSLRIGPVLSTSIGRYTRIEVNGTKTTDFDPAVHAWVMAGVRGAFDL